MPGSRPVHEPVAAPTRPLVTATAVAQDKPTAASAPRRWRTADLFGPAQEVEIEHGQAVYRLRRTSLGKLILTK